MILNNIFPYFSNGSFSFLSINLANYQLSEKLGRDLIVIGESGLIF